MQNSLHVIHCVPVLAALFLAMTLISNTQYRKTSQDVVEFVADELVLVVIGNTWVGWDHGVLGAYVYRVVHLPVDVSHLPRGMEQALGEEQDESKNTTPVIIPALNKIKLRTFLGF